MYSCFYFFLPPHSSWAGGLKLPNCRPSLRRDDASRQTSPWGRTTPSEWSALKYCESLCLNVKLGSYGAMRCISFKTSDCVELNRKGELRKIEGNGVIEDMKNPAKLGISYSYGEDDCTFNSCCCVPICNVSGFGHMNRRKHLNRSLFLAFSPPLLPVLDPVHGLHQHGPGVFLHGHPQTLPRGLCLDPEPDTNPARRHRGEGQGDLRQQQHRREQDDCQQAAGLWQNPVSSRVLRCESKMVLVEGEDDWYSVMIEARRSRLSSVI